MLNSTPGIRWIIPYWVISGHPFIVVCFTGNPKVKDARDSRATCEGRWFTVILKFYFYIINVNDYSIIEYDK